MCDWALVGEFFWEFGFEACFELVVVEAVAGRVVRDVDWVYGAGDYAGDGLVAGLSGRSWSLFPVALVGDAFFVGFFLIVGEVGVGVVEDVFVCVVLVGVV